MTRKTVMNYAAVLAILLTAVPAGSAENPVLKTQKEKVS